MRLVIVAKSRCIVFNEDMEQARNFEGEHEKEARPFTVGDTIFAADDIYDQNRLAVKRNTVGKITSHDTIHDWRVVFEGVGRSFGVNSADLSHDKVSEEVRIPEVVDRKEDYQ